MTTSPKHDEYNIKNYTDDELFNILGINHPTDRELEAKIIMMINKYSNIQNEDAFRIAIFYQNMYKHFFDIEDEDDENEDDENEEEENEEEMVEGFGDYEASQYKKNIDKNPVATVMNFTNPPAGTIDGKINDQFTVNTLFPSLNNIDTNVKDTANYYQDSTGAITTKEPTTKSTMADSYGINANIIGTQLFDYSKNPSGTNPLLKQTIKRIISIDSQFRNKQFQPLSTNYTFNLSEPLKDVLSLKLYSINIPYTWYTVSKAYGANFIYLKGITKGIDNGYHDYKIEIAPGNYSPIDLSNAINTSINNIQNTNPDIDFGQTGVSYNANTAKMTFTTDIQKVYNEQYYRVTFSNTDMAGYMGFDTNTNTFNIINSLNINNIINTSFNLDNNNNFFKVTRYFSSTITKENYGYNSYSNIIASYKINLLDDNNQIPIGSYTKDNIVNYVNNGITKYNNGLFSSISNMTYNSTTSQWNLTIDLNRYNLTPTLQPNEKVVVEFPDYNNTIGQNLWISSLRSLFNFDNSMNDLSIINAKTNVILDQISIQNTIIKFSCIRPNYTNTIVNDFSYNISIAQTSRITIYNTLNTQITSTNGIQFQNTNIRENISESKTNLVFDIGFTKTFSYKLYSIKIDQSRINISNPGSLLKNSSNTSNISILNKYFTIPENTVYDLFTNNSIDTTYNFYYANITDIKDNSKYYLYTFYPNANSNTTNAGNQFDISYDVYFLPPNKYNNSYQYIDLINALQDSNNIVYYLINTTSNPDNIHYNNTMINFSIRPNVFTNDYVTYNIRTAFNLVNTLSQDDYLINISYSGTITDNTPVSSEQNTINPLKYFGIEQSYNIVNLPGDISKRTITGRRDITSNTFNNVTDSTIIFTPTSDLSGVGGVNTFTIKIPQNTYSVDSLIIYLNTQLNTKINANSSIIGTFFSSKIIMSKTYIFLYANINITYTSKDYKLVFFDPYSFIKCIATANSIANATWDSTLGWTLGYRDFVDYEMVQSNLVQNQENKFYLTSKNGSYSYTSSTDAINRLEVSTTTTLAGDTTVSINTFNYFLIVLDDFIQNHLNDGLITISRPETQLPAQSYAAMANKVCDPLTGQIVSLSTSNIPGNNLTQQQLYALNAIQIASKINYNLNYSKGPYVQDIFGLVPIKPPSQPGQTYVEFGGTLQNQERQYFGPVNIHRMAIQLVNDKGDIVDLNGSDWSFSLVCEQLYNSA
jgi:hypothetical protein